MMKVNPEEKIRVGIIGMGFAGNVHVYALRWLPFTDVYAISSRSQRKAEERAQRLHVPMACGDYKDLLNDESIDVVHICTPNNLHYEMVKAALKAGKHVVCEKPLAMNSTQAKELTKLAEAAGLVAAVNFNYRGNPLVVEVKHLVESGELGEIFIIHGAYLQDWLFKATDYNWRLLKTVGGESRAVADIGSHWCDIIQYVTQHRIVEVYADLATIHKIRKRPKCEVETFAGQGLELIPEDYEEISIDAEDYGAVIFKTDKGASGVFAVSQVSAGRKNNLYFEINGSKKSIAWDQEKQNELWIGYRDGANQILLKDPCLLQSAVAREMAHYPAGHNEGWFEAIVNVFHSVYSHILTGKNDGNYATFRDGLNEVLLCEAILESYKLEKKIEINYEV